MSESKVLHLYNNLLKKFGNPCELWPQWCAKEKDLHTREIIAIGAILTQRTSWRNAEIALSNLAENNLLNLEVISKQDDLANLTGLIRTAGFYTTKPKRLYELTSFITKNGGIENLMKSDMDDLRDKLLGLYGIGPETADTLLLYAFDKPSFVVDEYTKRFVKKYGITEKNDYYYIKELFENSLAKDLSVYQNYHVLIIVDQKGEEWSRMSVVI